MFFAETALGLNLASAWVLIFLLSILLLMISDYLLVVPGNNVNAQQIRCYLWMKVMTPWFIASITISCVYLANQPDSYLSDSASWLHWHHLYYFSWSSWHGILLIISTGLFSILIMRALVMAWQHYKQQQKLHTLIAFSDDHSEFQDHELPMAITYGLFRPQVYISRALKDRLSSSDVNIIQAHEDCHRVHKDPLQQWLFILLVAFFPTRFSHKHVERMQLCMEQVADNYSRRVIGDHKQSHFLVADSLVKVARIYQQYHAKTGCGSDLEQLKNRIDYLTGQRQPSGRVWGQLLGQWLVLTLLSCISMDYLHHAFDLLFQH